MAKKKRVEVIVRGVLVHGGRVLLCRNAREGHVFLPGGHVDFGESAKAALEREMLEETGATLRAGAFLGAMEAAFEQRRRRSGKLKSRHEVNLVFVLEPAEGDVFDPDEMHSIEAELEFIWEPVDRIVGTRTGEVSVLPAGMERIIALHPAVVGGIASAGWESWARE